MKHVYIILDTWTNYDGWPISGPTIYGNRAFSSMDEASDVERRLRTDYASSGQNHSTYVKDLILDD